MNSLLKQFQKYTIFNNQTASFFLPVLFSIVVRFILIFKQSPESQPTEILADLYIPLAVDTFIVLMAIYLVPQRLLKTFFIFLCTYLFISNCIYIHHFKIYYLPPSIGAIAALFETSPLEAIEFTKMTNSATLFSTVFFSATPFLSFIFYKREIPQRNQQRFNLLIFSVLTMMALTWNEDSNKYFKSHILRDARNIHHYAREYFTLLQMRERRDNVTFHAQQSELLKNQKQIHVLVIGESLARNHMSLYGYNRKTTPKLDSSKSILVFRNVISPTTQTRSSIVRMLTTSFGLNTNRFYEEGSIITAMNDANFKTYWISNQGRYGISDTETSAIADDALSTSFINTDWNSTSHDERLIASLNSVLSKEENKQFIVLHLLGSHFEYDKRYPKNSNYSFSGNKRPDLSAEEQQIVDSYDATVKYTDFVIDSIIKNLNNQNCLSSLTFISDHGEDIYDNEQKLLGHGSPILSKYTVEIPFIMWLSNGYYKSRKIDRTALDFNQFYNNGNLFHSLADLYALEFEFFEKERSILRTDSSSSFYPYIINSNEDKVNYFELIND